MMILLIEDELIYTEVLPLCQYEIITHKCEHPCDKNKFINETWKVINKENSVFSIPKDSLKEKFIKEFVEYLV